MGIRECVSLPLKPLQVHKPNHKSNKSAEPEQEKDPGLWRPSLQTGFGNVSMKLMVEPSKWCFKNNYKGPENDFNVAVSTFTQVVHLQTHRCTMHLR